MDFVQIWLVFLIGTNFVLSVFSEEKVQRVGNVIHVLINLPIYLRVFEVI